MRRTTLALALLHLPASTTEAAKGPASSPRACYWVDGSVSKISWPCNTATTGHSTCCHPGATCYSNGVCKFVLPRGNLDWLRVGCTDPTWEDPACLKQCVPCECSLGVPRC